MSDSSFRYDWCIERWQPVEQYWLPYLYFDDLYKCLDCYYWLAERLCAEEFQITHISEVEYEN